MLLREIFKDAQGIRITGNPAAVIGGITNDSRKVKKGDLFFAVIGQKEDGNK